MDYDDDTVYLDALDLNKQDLSINKKHQEVLRHQIKSICRSMVSLATGTARCLIASTASTGCHTGGDWGDATQTA